VRRLCDHCKEPVADPAALLRRLEIPLPAGPLPPLWRGRGCAACKNTGYRGRLGIFELMMVDAAFHEPIVKRAGAQEFTRLAREGGMKGMFEDGLRRVYDGQTTVEEVLRVTRMH
jgi:type IV pilus assembly protein PilB